MFLHIPELRVLNYPSIFRFAFVNHVVLHTGIPLYLLTMSFLPQLQQTNTHLGARPTRIGKARNYPQAIRQRLE